MPCKDHLSFFWHIFSPRSFCCRCSLLASGLCWVCNSVWDVLWHNGGVTYDGIMNAEKESAFNWRQQIFPNGRKRWFCKNDMLGRGFRRRLSLGGWTEGLDWCDFASLAFFPPSFCSLITVHSFRMPSACVNLLGMQSSEKKPQKKRL